VACPFAGQLLCRAEYPTPLDLVPLRAWVLGARSLIPPARRYTQELKQLTVVVFPAFTVALFG